MIHYQISRAGQTYGPYTLEDLRRYIASGNVLLTDLAKSDEMSEWIPVAQLLQGNSTSESNSTSAESAAQTREGQFAGSAPQAGASDFQNPSYTNPGAGATYVDPVYSPVSGPAGGVIAGQYPDPPNLNWGLYLLFTILTCGLFSKVFTVIQAAWLKKVQPNSNGLIFYIALYVLLIINYFRGVGVWAGMIAHPGVLPHRGGYGGGVLTLLYFILLFVTRFVMSASLEEHFNGPEPIGLRLNPVLVFFLGGIYFQYQFNRINALKQAARYGVGRIF